MKWYLIAVFTILIMSKSYSDDFVKVCLTMVSGGIEVNVLDESSSLVLGAIVHVENEAGEIILSETVRPGKWSTVAFYITGKYKIVVTSKNHDYYESDFMELKHSPCAGLEAKKLRIQLSKKQINM